MTRREYIAIGIMILLVCSVLFIEHRPIVYPRRTIAEQKEYNAKWRVLPEFKKNRGRAFNELTLRDDGLYVMDVDFDGVNDIVNIKDCEAEVYRFDPAIRLSKNVSKQVPYCFLVAHLCCDAHKAFTTFNYSTKTIYIEAHYGSGYLNTSIRQFQKVGEEWKEVIPVTPSYIINKKLYPPLHVFMQYHGSRIRQWSRGDGRGGFYHYQNAQRRP